MPDNETHIFPFHGLRYAANADSTLSDLTAPPFDAVDKVLQQTLYEKHPHNVIRLDLNKIEETDSADNNAYTRANDCFRQWQAEGVLVPEKEAAIYLYRQSWEDKTTGQTLNRQGFIALLEVEHYETKRVLPHESTLIGPKSDRMNLMKLTSGNFSPIFMLYADPSRILETTVINPHSDNDTTQCITDVEDVTHQFTPLTDPDAIQSIQNVIKHQQLLIADGHHRYETAVAFMEDARLRYQEITGERASKGSLLSDYTMVYLANLHDPGLEVYPTHRILHQWPEGFTQASFEAELFNCFEAVENGEDFCYQSANSLQASQAPLKLRLKDSKALTSLPVELHGLDTAILETTVFKGIFNTTGLELKKNRTLGFSPEKEFIEEQLQNNTAVAAFLLKTPPLTLIKHACEQGLRMPLKSTFFYPKLLSGLVFYSYAQFSNHQLPTHALSGVILNAKPIPDNAFDRIKDNIDYRMALIPD